MGDWARRVRGGLVLPLDHGAADPYPAEPAPEAPRRRGAVSAGRGDLRPSSMTSGCTTSSPTQDATWACSQRHLAAPTHPHHSQVDEFPGLLRCPGRPAPRRRPTAHTIAFGCTLP
eukprot:40250-Prorocentrum_minimum.AAC.1